MCSPLTMAEPFLVESPSPPKAVCYRHWSSMCVPSRVVLVFMLALLFVWKFGPTTKEYSHATSTRPMNADPPRLESPNVHPQASGNVQPVQQHVVPVKNSLYAEHPWTILDAFLCAREIDILVVVHSVPQNHEWRQAIRETYAKDAMYKYARIRAVFALGRSENYQMNQNIQKEGKFHKDIIQQDFADTQANETIKFLMWMRFVRDFCPTVKYVLKINENVAANMFMIVHHSLYEPSVRINRAITCNTRAGEGVDRNPSSTWYVPVKWHPSNEWETHCAEDLMMWRASLCEELISAVEQEEHYYSSDGAFFTGLIADRIKAPKNGLWHDKWNLLPERTQDYLYSRKAIYGLIDSPTMLRNIWNNLTAVYLDDQRYVFAQ